MDEKVEAMLRQKFGRLPMARDYAMARHLWRYARTLDGQENGEVIYNGLHRGEKEWWLKMAIAANDMPWPREGDSLFKERHDLKDL